MTPGPTIATCVVCERDFDTGRAVDPMAAYTCGDCIEAREQIEARLAHGPVTLDGVLDATGRRLPWPVLRGVVEWMLGEHAMVETTGGFGPPDEEDDDDG